MGAEPVPSTSPELFLARIREALSEHFHYPAVARRRGWQGEVVLDFRLRADGGIEGIRIARGSGYAMLDRAAVDSLEQVGRLPSGMTPPRAMELALPIVYRLDG